MFACPRTPVTAPSSARAAMIRNEASERRKSCEARSISSSSPISPALDERCGTPSACLSSRRTPDHRDASRARRAYERSGVAGALAESADRGYIRDTSQSRSNFKTCSQTAVATSGIPWVLGEWRWPRGGSRAANIGLPRRPVVPVRRLPGLGTAQTPPYGEIALAAWGQSKPPGSVTRR